MSSPFDIKLLGRTRIFLESKVLEQKHGCQNYVLAKMVEGKQLFMLLKHFILYFKLFV